MTHTGDHLGVPASHKTVHITGITIARIENGKIVEGWDNWDQLAMMQQIRAGSCGPRLRIVADRANWAASEYG